ncbi:MAG: hypothetical protein V3R95_05875 [Dehalococcoidia bacterium]
MADNEATGELGAVAVIDRHGQSVTVGTLWEQRPIVLALIRHFG